MSMRAAFAELRESQGEPQQIDLEDVTGKPEQAAPRLSDRIMKAEAQRVVRAKLPAKGRTPGKNQNPEFHKLTVYIPMKTRRAVAIKIASDGGDMELSTLVTKLLDGWTANRSDV